MKLPFFSKKTEGMINSGSLDPEFAKGIIKSACDSKKNVEVVIPGARDSFSSFFVGYRDDGSTFYLDTLIPRPRRDILREGRSFAILFFLHNIHYQLTAVFAGVENWKGFDSLILKPPLRLENKQKREFFRVEPSLGSPVKVFVKDGREYEEWTTALDISVSGVRYRSAHIRPPGEMKVNLELPGSGVCIQGLTLQIIEQGEIDMSGTGRPLEKPYFARGRFLDMDSRSSDLISRYIMVRQREINALFA